MLTRKNAGLGKNHRGSGPDRGSGFDSDEIFGFEREHFKCMMNIYVFVDIYL